MSRQLKYMLLQEEIQGSKNKVLITGTASDHEFFVKEVWTSRFVPGVRGLENFHIQNQVNETRSLAGTKASGFEEIDEETALDLMNDIADKLLVEARQRIEKVEG